MTADNINEKDFPVETPVIFDFYDEISKFVSQCSA